MTTGRQRGMHDPMLGSLPTFAHDAAAVAVAQLGSQGRVLVLGETGVGKSTLCQQVADTLAASGRRCWVISADPGTPAFGPPGCLCAAQRSDAAWHQHRLAALCTLDAGRFRLPLVVALARLVNDLPEAPLLVDGPGVMRGMAAAELLHGMVEAARIRSVILVARTDRPVPLAEELAASPVPVVVVPAAHEASPPSKAERAVVRTAQWDAYLEDASDLEVALGNLGVAGASPPPDLPNAWTGRQVALVRGDGRTLAVGEVVEKEGERLRIRAPVVCAQGAASVLVRDARRLPSGLLGTSPGPDARPTRGRARFETGDADTSDMMPAGHSGDPVFAVSVHVASARVVLVNGLFEDPLLHVRFRHQRRILLFDLGDAVRLQARIAHQVSDVFITHAHVDHIGGFIWLLRARIGIPKICRLFGPPGLSEHIDGMIRGIQWDRVGERGPRFEVAELDGTRLRRFELCAGRRSIELLGERCVENGVLLLEPAFCVRAVTLDHGTPVLAYALEESRHLNIRKERLAATGLAPGPWLERLRRHVHASEHDVALELPDGSRRRVSDLAAKLILERPGEKLAYVTDLADTPENRARVVGLARHAHTLFCEAAFAQEDAAQAHDTQHLTARACGEIAAAAGVGQLIPFHLSRRYDAHPEKIYGEALAAFDRTVVPPDLRARVTGLSP